MTLAVISLFMGGEEEKKKQNNLKQSRGVCRWSWWYCCTARLSRWGELGGWVGGLWKGPVGFLGRGWGHELSVRVRRAFAVLGLLGCRAAVYVLQEDFLSDWLLDALPHSWHTNTDTQRVGGLATNMSLQIPPPTVWTRQTRARCYCDTYPFFSPIR